MNLIDYPLAPTVTAGGKTFKIVDGAAYEVQGDQLVFVIQLYDKDFYANNYRQINGQLCRYVDDQHSYPVRTSMADSFENAATIRDLVTPARGWSSITLQGPKTPSVQQYVELRHRILAGGNFLDNRIEPSASVYKTGKQSLRALAYPSSPFLPVSKASLECELLHLRKGEHFWLSGWFGIKQGYPGGLFDVESSFIVDYPGPRLLLDRNLKPRIELKWADKPTYLSTASFPRNKGFHLKFHLLLSDQDGKAELWLDGQKIINATGQTLPLADTVLDRLEIGIPANSEPYMAEVFVDDLQFGVNPL